MDKLLFRSLLVLMPGLWLLTATSAQANVFEWKSEDESKSINVGGAVRVNQRYESWGEENSSGVGNLKFDIFRLDVDGKYDDFYLESQQTPYLLPFQYSLRVSFFVYQKRP